MALVIVPMLPALANKVTSKNVHIPKELSNLFAINWLYGLLLLASCTMPSIWSFLILGHSFRIRFRVTLRLLRV
jgi:hypothetical protein